MAPLKLTFAASEYDHFHDLVSGEVAAEGIELNYLKLTIEEVFFRFTRFREWDVSEMSMGKYISLKSQGDESITAIPVFPSRVFRQSSLYVRADSPLKGAEELAIALTARASSLVPPEGGSPPGIRAAATPAEALDRAGLVVTATTSEAPVFSPEHLEPGAHINAIGAFQPHTREIPEAIVARARVIVDQREAIWEEAGDLIIPVEKGIVGRDVIDAELGEIVNGGAPGGRGDREFTLFKSVGNAAQDVAIAEAALRRAEDLGLGTVVPF